MNTYKVMIKSIELASEAKYLLSFSPELAKYGTIQKLVRLSQEWQEAFDSYIKESNKEV